MSEDIDLALGILAGFAAIIATGAAIAGLVYAIYCTGENARRRDQ